MNGNIEIEHYIEEHCDKEPELLKELSRKTHLNIMRPRMLSGNVQGQFLKMLCRLTNAQRVLEIGTYTGYASIAMASGMPTDGILYTIDINDEIEDFTRNFIEQKEEGGEIRFLVGDACELIPTIDEMFDLVFIDADKRQYSDYYALVFDKVKHGGLIVADDVLWDGKILEEKEHYDAQTQGILDFNKLITDDPRVEKVLLPLRHGLFLIRKK